MAEQKKAKQPDTKILSERKYLKIALNDGQEWMCRLLNMDRYNLHIETEFAEILLPKHSVKYYVLEPYNDELEEQDIPSSLKLSEILIPTLYEKHPPHAEKIDRALVYYQEHGKFDKQVAVQKIREGWLLTDGYTRYLAAEELGLEDVPVRVIESVQERKGTVKAVLHDYGFITMDDGKDVFFHRTALENVDFKDLKPGDAVEFILEEKAKETRAICVKRI